MSEKQGSRVRPPFIHSETTREPVVAEESKGAAWPKQPLGAFDWKSAASLRAPENPGLKAEREWDSTEWADALAPVSDEARRVAEQLDTVSQKIRMGELSIHGKAPTQETAMVAALEALIRSR